jgi:hypothetical protein
MPLIGLWSGRMISVRYETMATVLGGLILLGVAGHLPKEVLEQEDETADFSFSTMRTAALAGPEYPWMMAKTSATSAVADAAAIAEKFVKQA